MIKPGTTTGKPATPASGKPATSKPAGKPGFNPLQGVGTKKK